MGRHIGDFSLDVLRTYRPELTNKPEDFDAFWNEQKENISNIQPKVKLEWRDYPIPSVEVADITFESWDKTPISGILIKPKGANSFPLLQSYHGYTGSRGQAADYLKWLTLGVAVIAFDVRGQGDSPDFATYRNGSRIEGWMLHGIDDPSQYYYTNVNRDIIMQTNWVNSNDFPFEVTSFGVMGGSQGGGLAINAAGLHEGVDFLISDYPYIAHFERALEVALSGPYLEIVNYFKWNDPQYEKYEQILHTLSYIDCVHFCSAITCPTLMAIGLEDAVTPPSTVFAAYNHLHSEDKQIEIYPQFKHELNPFHEEKKLAFVAKQLKR